MQRMPLLRSTPGARAVATRPEPMAMWSRSVRHQRPLACSLFALWLLGAERAPFDLCVGLALVLWIAAIEMTSIAGRLGADFWQRVVLAVVLARIGHWFVTVFPSIVAAWWSALTGRERAQSPVGSIIELWPAPPWWEYATTGDHITLLVVIAGALLAVHAVPNRWVRMVQPLLTIASAGTLFLQQMGLWYMGLWPNG